MAYNSTSLMRTGFAAAATARRGAITAAIEAASISLRVMCAIFSPIQLAAKLQNARIARAVHQAEGTDVNRRRRVIELSVVEQVEELGADLQPRGFAHL